MFAKIAHKHRWIAATHSKEEQTRPGYSAKANHKTNNGVITNIFEQVALDYLMADFLLASKPGRDFGALDSGEKTACSRSCGLRTPVITKESRLLRIHEIKNRPSL